MKACQSEKSKPNDRENIFGINKTEENKISYFNPENFTNEEQKKLLNMPIKDTLGNGGQGNFFPQKRNYRDLFLPELGRSPNNYNNIDNTRVNDNNRSTINNIFYNEPSLINKIRRDENIKDNTYNNNLFTKVNNNNVIINNLIINNANNNNIINNNEINNISNNNINENDDYIQIKGNEQDEEKEESKENQIEKQKKIINEYSIIEKTLKEEQNLFLDDNCHISTSNAYEKIPEKLSSFIVSKRVNFPKEIYQDISSSSSNNNNENQSDNYTVICPAINCIIFVQKNCLIFFNYINETSLKYTDITKPVKKLLITTPKPGMFVNDIKYIMICVMEGEIQILTLAFNRIVGEEDDLPIIHKTDFIFNFNETVIDIISTANNRIFMSTTNNKIFELKYNIRQNNYFNFFGTRNTLEAINKEKPFFFGLFTDIKFIFKRSIEIIHKLKVDDTRHILYAIKYTIPKDDKNVDLDNIIDSSVIIFDLGIDGKGFNKVEEISQEDLGDYGMDFNGFNFFSYNMERDMNENNNYIQKSNVIVDITPLTRDKYKDYHLLIMKRNGHKIFLKFNTFIDDSNIKNQEEILKFNGSAFCRERITDRFITAIKLIPTSKSKNNDYNNNNKVLYDLINYFPFCTFCYYKNTNPNEENFEEYILNAIEDDFSDIATKENIGFFTQNKGLKEKEQVLFKTTTNTKQLYSIIKLSDCDVEDCCGLGNLLKHSNNFFISKNTKYIDNGQTETVSYNCMHEYAKQLFYSPEEYGMLFSDEFIIFKKLRPIDTLIEIIQSKNIKNNLLEERNNINNNTNESNNNSYNDYNSNNRGKRISISSFVGHKNKINDPFLINKEFVIKKNFRDFVNIHGYIETTVMILNIITNNNFCYYIKNNIENPNFINDNNRIDNNVLNINDLQRYYLNPYSLIKAKNNNQLMNLGQEFLMKLFTFAKEEIDIQIINYQNLLQNLLNNMNPNINLNNNNNLRFKLNNNINNNVLFQELNKLFEAKNFMSYGFILFLSRIIRLFWEESIFVRQKLYYGNENFEFNIVNNLNQNQIMIIKNMLIKFINNINQYKIELLQNAADISTKLNKYKNYLNDIEQFFNNNSLYSINEIKKKLTLVENNILNYHKKTMHYFLSTFNFEKFSNDLEIIINIANRLIEILNFMDMIYKINITRELQRRKSYNILNIKIKDLFRGNYPFIINELLQIIFEIYRNEKNMEFASLKYKRLSNNVLI